ncbi:hypothetical protein [Elizabethkingia ursingii]|uniref:hypothetical protein n=1 Tax=Elizabethkingia ursingii TaxID=1756150 RepID=UPI000AEB2948|nr:hypothetical protein [Elizabethkingia ursingii]
MRKKILFAPLWGIFALSLLSSCRTEDGAIAQKQIEDKRFAVFVPKDGKTVDYANGFASLMKKYDQVHLTNISGINNKPSIKNLSASNNKSGSSFQDIGKYIEFKIRSQTVIEENGNKWVAFPKVENEKVTGLIIATLRDKETQVVFTDLDSNDQFYTENLPLFQQALDRYLSKKKSKLNVVASIKNGAIASVDPGADPGTDPPAYETDIEGVTVKGKPKPSDNGTNGLPIGPSTPIACEQIQGCYNPAETGGGASAPYLPPPADINYDKLKDFPCAYALAQQLTNEKIGGDLARLLKETFGANERVNISFETSDNKFLGEQVTGGFRFTGDANNFNGIVYLNKDRLSNATQNFLLSTMYHEVLHGYLDYERNRIGETEFNNRYPAMESHDVKLGNGATMKQFSFIGTDLNHNRMGPFINGIKQAVLNFDPSYPPDRAEALAMGGIIAESSLPAGYRSIGPHEADGSTAALGKRCSN